MFVGLVKPKVHRFTLRLIYAGVLNVCFKAVKTFYAPIVNFGVHRSCLSSNWFKLALLID